jgi:hypothetical protein
VPVAKVGGEEHLGSGFEISPPGDGRGQPAGDHPDGVQREPVGHGVGVARHERFEGVGQGVYPSRGRNSRRQAHGEGGVKDAPSRLYALVAYVELALSHDVRDDAEAVGLSRGAGGRGDRHDGQAGDELGRGICKVARGAAVGCVQGDRLGRVHGGAAAHRDDHGLLDPEVPQRRGAALDVVRGRVGRDALEHDAVHFRGELLLYEIRHAGPAHAGVRDDEGAPPAAPGDEPADPVHGPHAEAQATVKAQVEAPPAKRHARTVPHRSAKASRPAR